MKKKKAAIYARVSTLLNQNPELQVEACAELAQNRDFEVVSIYIDRCSGTKDSRPELDKMLNQARKGEFNIIIFQAIDRLGRSQRHLLSILDKFRCWGVTPIFIRENLDLESLSGKLLFSFFAALSQHEQSITSERVKSSLQIKKAIAEKTNNGWTCGRPPLNSDIKNNVLKLHAKGLSIRAIAKQLGTLSKSSVDRIIKNHKIDVPKT